MMSHNGTSAQEMTAAASGMLPPDSCSHLLTRREQLKIFRLRTGRNSRNHHLHTKFGTGQTGECSCNMGQQTADHNITPDMPKVRSCLRQHLAITHELGEETQRFSGGFFGQRLHHPSERLGWVSEPGRTTNSRRRMWQKGFSNRKAL